MQKLKKLIGVIIVISFLLFQTEVVLAGSKNYPPSITSFFASKTVIYSGETITLSVKAKDKNKDKIYFEWSVAGNGSETGKLSSRTSSKVTWTAPKVLTDTYFNIKLKVYDSKKAAVYKTVKILVKPKTLSQLFEELKSSSVVVATPGGTGSGVVISPDGRILTCYHVIKGQNRAEVILANGEKYSVEKLERYDYINDWAIIKINAKNLKSVSLTTKLPDVGHQIFTIGNPRGLGWSISSGIVSSSDREIYGNKYIQITAPVNPGNSGGPLFNMKGELVGIINMKLADSEGLNFAIPCKTILDNLEKAMFKDAPLYDVFNDTSYKEQINSLVDFLNNGNHENFNPLVIGSTNYGRVLYQNGIYVDNETGLIMYGVDIIVNYNQFRLMYLNHLINNEFNNSFSFFSYYFTKTFSDAIGTTTFDLWYGVYDELDYMPTDNLVPAENIKYVNGKYVVDWYFYYARSGFNNFEEKWY
ncbi:S1C family serine protease [Carboxydothermus ferrireducens]|uniref:S1-C subfamily serine protease n=1 Tax=Carboxydothermus ferrireducens DSM 11255 TaxID=1119529 RepID=A0ABX2R7I0_9THEO|nr:S1C family serine protease [Carboxydothermus ferrireducens]NYE57122.1 S1-C subfamily serine protease [Carboxydothermus ferrireducens DSM 11255]